MTPFFLVLLLVVVVVVSAASAEATTAGSSSSISKATSFSVPLPDSWLPSIIDLKQQMQGHDEVVAWKDVMSCCQPTTSTASASANNDEDEDDCITDDSSDSDSDGNNSKVCVTTAATKRRKLKKEGALSYKQITIGQLPQFTKEQTLQVLYDHALKAWNGGAGIWPSQYTLKQRCDAIEQFFHELKSKREIIVQTLMYEIGKNRMDAESEFDRTIEFAMELIHTIKTNPEFASDIPQIVGNTRAFIRRGSIGIIMALAPYNYPLNECYATIIPALLMGNVVVLKIPSVGGLVHVLTMDAFRRTLPPGVINFVSGKGRNTMPILMETGHVDGLAFIGGSKAADSLIKSHPHPHRLKVFLQLEANNMAIYLSDLFDNDKNNVNEPLNNALSQAVSGSLSFNGQRCTALKLHFVPKPHAHKFVKELVKRVEALAVGLPDEKHFDDNKYSTITPLPAGANRVQYMKELIDDAVKKGAKIMNQSGGTIVGGNGNGKDDNKQSTLMIPAVLYPVHSDMRIYHEEQFGPIVPVVEYTDINEVLEYGRTNPFGQQVSIFGYDSNYVSTIIDQFANVFGRINLNVQCGRSPDTLPFSGRRSSAMGVMSVLDSLREFSIPTVIAYKHDGVMNKKKEQHANEVKMRSNFLQPVV